MKTKGANEQAAKTISLVYHLSPPNASTVKKAINKSDYTLAHYLIFTKLVSTEADALKNLYLKIGSMRPSLRLTSEQLCLIQMPEVF